VVLESECATLQPTGTEIPQPSESSEPTESETETEIPTCPKPRHHRRKYRNHHRHSRYHRHGYDAVDGSRHIQQAVSKVQGKVLSKSAVWMTPAGIYAVCFGAPILAAGIALITAFVVRRNRAVRRPIDDAPLVEVL
jgi:hypothetical protein